MKRGLTPPRRVDATRYLVLVEQRKREVVVIALAVGERSVKKQPSRSNCLLRRHHLSPHLTLRLARCLACCLACCLPVLEEHHWWRGWRQHRGRGRRRPRGRIICQGRNPESVTSRNDLRHGTTEVGDGAA